MKNKLEYLAEALAEFGLSGASQIPATAYGGYKAATTPGGFTDRLRAFQGGAEDLTYMPRGEAAQDVYGAIQENTPEFLAEGLQNYGEWASENPTLSIPAEALLGTVGGGAGNALKREIFRGPKDDIERALGAKAQVRIEQGEDPAEVWRDLGWGQHPTTGQHITEVDDSGIKVKMIPNKKTGGKELEKAIDHPELFAASPSAKNTMLSSEAGRGGTYYPGPDAITIGTKYNLPEWKDTLVHELDHRTAREFGLPKGGSPKQFGYDEKFKEVDKAGKLLATHLRNLKDKNVLSNDDAKSILDTVNASGQAGVPASLAGVFDSSKLPKADHAILVQTLGRWNRGMEDKNKAYQQYRDIDGEAMARLSEGRRLLTASERREDYPLSPGYFERLTKSRLEDLKPAPKGGGVQ
jgi:hypothetical protein